MRALDLPEIRAHVGSFLQEEDLAACLSVCRDWHTTFMPLRWRDVRIVGIHSVRADVNLRKHAHFVRSLSFLRILSLRHLSSIDRYTHLERIHVTKTDIDGRVVWDKLSALVQQNHRTLRIMMLEDMMPLSEFMGVLGNRDTEGRSLELNELVWKRVTVRLPCLAMFSKASRIARTLVLECMIVKGLGSGAGLLSSNFLASPPPTESSSDVVEATTRPPRLRPPPSCRVQHLRISWTIDFPLDLQLLFWIQPCSQLRSLVWEAFSFPEPLISHFADLLRSNTWPHLASLEITSCLTQHPSDTSLAELLDASPNLLEKLIFRNVDFGPQAFRSLRRHFPRLHTLQWVNCSSKVTSAMASEVLQSCEALEVFQAPYLLIEDMMTPLDELQHTEDQPLGQEQLIDQQQERYLPFSITSPVEAGATTTTTTSPSRPWVCSRLHTLYIAATVPSYSSPPLTKEEERVISSRLELLKDLRSCNVGATISSAPPFAPNPPL